MNELVKTITSTSWWIGVIGVGFVLNLLTAYAKSPIDRLLGSISRGWQLRSERSSAKRKALINKLRVNEHLQILYIAREQRMRMQELAYLCLACLFTIMSYIHKLANQLQLNVSLPTPPNWFTYFTGGMLIVSLLISLSLRFSATKYAGLVEEAAFNKSDL